MSTFKTKKLSAPHINLETVQKYSLTIRKQNLITILSTSRRNISIQT